MSRTPSIKPDQILTAAREVFLEKGIRATTAEVARRAGVAEGSVFKHFKTKDELFLACMEPGFDDVPWIRTLRRCSKESPRSEVERLLIEAGVQAIEFFRAIMPLVMMSWSNKAGAGLPMHMAGPNPPPVRAIVATTHFFANAIRAGAIRRQDPKILARVFVASMWHYVFINVFLKEQRILALAPKKYVRGVVRLVLHNEDVPLPDLAPAAARRTRKKK